MKPLTILRAMFRTGRHLYEDFADAGKRAEGWRMMQAAKRAARRLGIARLL